MTVKLDMHAVLVRMQCGLGTAGLLFCILHCYIDADTWCTICLALTCLGGAEIANKLIGDLIICCPSFRLHLLADFHAEVAKPFKSRSTDRSFRIRRCSYGPGCKEPRNMRWAAKLWTQSILKQPVWNLL